MLALVRFRLPCNKCISRVLKSTTCVQRVWKSTALLSQYASEYDTAVSTCHPALAYAADKLSMSSMRGLVLCALVRVGFMLLAMHVVEQAGNLESAATIHWVSTGSPTSAITASCVSAVMLHSDSGSTSPEPSPGSAGCVGVQHDLLE